MVKRILVEKKKGFDTEAKSLLDDIRENLLIKGIEDVRIINRYDVQDVDEEALDHARVSVFSEPVTDNVFDEEIDLGNASHVFAYSYLPGQYDQRADSAAQCIQLISMKEKPLVKSSRIVALYGNLSADDLKAVKSYCINPVDSQEDEWEKPDTLVMDNYLPSMVETVENFCDMSAENLEKYRAEMGLAMSEEDLSFVQKYFSETEKRNPTVTEIRVIDTYWSDHCRHTTFNTRIVNFEFDSGMYSEMIAEELNRYFEIRKEVYGVTDRDISLMDLGVIGAKYLRKKGLLEDLDESEEINACSIKVTAEIDGKPEDWLVMFKNETHNHPTEIEPFGGAATCLGGAIRDPLSGRVYVYQAMRVTGSADPRALVSDTLPGKLPQRKITREAAHGYSSYGNQIGLATGLVDEIYHNHYMAKRMEVGAVIGAAPAENVVRERPAPGDVVILVGGRTGRDGCGGATGSSKEHTEESILLCGAEVQKGNPPVERNIQRLFRRKEAAVIIKRCNDFGAGGVSVAIGELADSIDVNLDLVPKKYDGLDGTELAISESQERMAVVVSSENAEKFISLAQEENLEAVTVAHVTDTGRFKMYWHGNLILDLSREFLDTNGVKQSTYVYIKNDSGYRHFDDNEMLPPMMMLDNLNVCSKKGLSEMFDSTIGAGSVLMPLGGKYQLTPALGMAAKLPLTSGYTDTTTLMTYGFDPYVSDLSPYHGAIYAVIDSAAKINAMGGDYSKARLSFQEFYEKLGEDPEKWAKPFTALLGALRAQVELKIPAIGGKDSMSGTFMDINVPPTLISFAVSVTDANKVISPEFKKTDSHVVLVRLEYDNMKVPDFECFRKNMSLIKSLNEQGKILSANTVGRGGVFASVIKMSVGNMIGVTLNKVSRHDFHCLAYGSVILELPASENPSELLADCPHQILGTTNAESRVWIEVVDEKGNNFGTPLDKQLSEFCDRWKEPLESVFPTKTEHSEKTEKTGKTEKKANIFFFKDRSLKKPAVSVAKPRVFIPSFPGTNCEMDSKRAFDSAGGLTEIQVFKNLSQQMIDESIREMAQQIRKSQILMIPGGFSGGDEPDGSAKFIAAIFRNPLIHEAIDDLMENRDGLILGICNGFQALIKTGLVPYGKIVDQTDESPTLTYNTIGRHSSCLVRTRIASVNSPWLSNVNVGDIHTIPVSHGEGRFVASEKMIRQLADSGQIATQYVDFDGFPNNDTSFNPNNSVDAIEGILSPDGRIFGKMGHSERIGRNLYKNVPGEKDQKLFEAGINYFE